LIETIPYDSSLKDGALMMKNMVRCPKCQHEFSLELTCRTCGYRWRPRSDNRPTVCPNPKCKSPYWDKPYIRKPKNKKAKK